jgi:outer membrane lipoprotein-sorting protein
VRTRRLLSNLALALVVSACATAAPPPGPPPLADEVRRLVALLTLRRDEFADLRTLSEVTVRRGAAVQRFAGALLVKPPASVRFEALSPFGQPFLVVAMSDGTLTSYNVVENAALTGPVGEKTSGRWLGVPLGPEDIVGLLIGRVLPPAGMTAAEILPADGAGPSIQMVGRDRTARVWMDFETGEVRKVEISGRHTLIVDYRPEPSRDLPAEIHAIAPGTGFEITVRYRQPALATGIDAERFRLTVPQGANVQRFY